VLKTRRGFFRRSGLVVGGTLVMGASPSRLRAQAGSNDPLQDCSPIPPPPATAVPFVSFYVLHIQGIDIPPDKHAFIRVFVEKPDADATTGIDSPNFVGQFSIVASGKAMPAGAHAAAGGGHKHIQNKAFILSDHHVAMMKAKSSLDVKLVSAGSSVKSLPYKRVYIAIR
jgi:hypothetical protein